MANKNTISIHRYKHAPTAGWAGYAEDSHKSWILFFGEDGRALFYPSRDSDGGVEGVAPVPSN